MASDQWKGGTYLQDGIDMINAMRNNELFTDGSIQNGDTWSNTNALYPDYFSPAYYRVFAKAAEDPFWGDGRRRPGIQAPGRADRDRRAGSELDEPAELPDRQHLQPPSALAYTCDLKYGYDACRMPWRIGMDCCWNNEPRALTYLMAIGGYFTNNGGVASIGDAYTSPNGPNTSQQPELGVHRPGGCGGHGGWLCQAA